MPKKRACGGVLSIGCHRVSYKVRSLIVAIFLYPTVRRLRKKLVLGYEENIIPHVHSEQELQLIKSEN